MPRAGRLRRRVRAEHLVERTNKASDGSTNAPRILRRIDQHETVMHLAALICRVGKGNKVGNVLGHDGSPFLLSQGEQGAIGEGAELGSFGHCDHIVATVTKLLSDGRRVHLVNKEPQPSASCARSHTRRWRSASSRLRWIRESISS